MNVPKLLPLNSSIFDSSMEYQIKHTKTFRYQASSDNNRLEKVLYVLHGYGQLIEFFIRKFRNVPKNLLIVAPEGMHRFYLDGTSGRVGASWMTKEARETDIKDTISYLNKVDQEVSTRYAIKKRFLLGFSQGGATAARWEQLGSVNFDGVILWACIFPPDLAIANTNKLNSNHFFVIGNQDEYFSKSAQQELSNYYSGQGYQIVSYHGTHDIVNETLTEILRQMDSNL